MFASRTDKNHLSITWELRQYGCSVQDLSNVGNGCPDIICGYRKKNYLFEIKTEKGKLNKRQERWHGVWMGSVHVIRSFEDAIKIINAGYDTKKRKKDKKEKN